MIDRELLCGCCKLPESSCSSGCLIAQNIETHRHLLASVLAVLGLKACAFTSCLSLFVCLFQKIYCYFYICVSVCHMYGRLWKSE